MKRKPQVYGSLLYELIQEEDKTDEEIIEYCKSLPKEELSKQILWIDDQICSYPNALFGCIEIGQMRYKLAHYLYLHEPLAVDKHGKNKVLYNILVNLSNALTFGDEEMLPTTFEDGVKFFTEVIKDIEEIELNQIDLDHCSLGWLALRFESTIFMKLLIDHGWKVDNRYEGLTPFLTCLVNGKYNLPMVEYLLEHGADINAIAENDTSPGEKYGYHFIRPIAFYKVNCPELPPPKGCNYREILLMIFEHLQKYEILLNHSSASSSSTSSRHPIYSFLDRFHIAYEEKTAEECCICYLQSNNCVQLACSHYLHKTCGAFIQQSNGEVSCPLCRQKTYFENDKKLSLSVILKTLSSSEKIVTIYPNECKISDLFVIAQKTFNYPFLRILYDGKSLDANDQHLLKSLPNLLDHAKFYVSYKL